MGDWQERSNKRRDERHTKVDDSPKPASAKKDTKSFCKGKVGREHKLVCMKRKESYLKEWRELVCTVCGKRLETYYGKGEKPEWVTE